MSDDFKVCPYCGKEMAKCVELIECWGREEVFIFYECFNDECERELN
jgi:hypothetical protein